MSVCARLSENQRVRRNLPENGRLHIDRQLPFLCIYRQPTKNEDWGTSRLAITSASYLVTSAKRSIKQGINSLLEKIVQAMMEVFGAYLVLEIWSGPPFRVESLDQLPKFRVFQPRMAKEASTFEVLRKALETLKIPGTQKQFDVLLETSAKIAPPGMAPILTKEQLKNLGCILVGIEVPPVYRNSDGSQSFPINLRLMRRGFHNAIKKTFFEFTRSETQRKPKNFHSIGRRAVVKAVWNADNILAEVNNSFDFLLLVTPTNTDAEWFRFQRNKYQLTPRFAYRPLPLDPALAKRRLYSCHIERIEDPTLARMFIEMQQELDRKLSMLSDRNTKNFLYGSQQVFDTVEDSLLDESIKLLRLLPKHTREKRNQKKINAEELATLAFEEIQHYRKNNPDINAVVELRKDITGLMVSRGNLLIGTMAPISKLRASALIQHEVGTHILTYYNGAVQPFKMLQQGLPGYEELQEGLAVLAEYLVGGLDKARLRLLAARVIAAHAMSDGASFQEVFNTLWKDHRFSGRTSFNITMRVFRSGGLTKDAVYLKGLLKLLEYLGSGGDFEPLLVGKFDIQHVPLISELQSRQVLKPMPLRPRYLDENLVQKRLELVKSGASIQRLMEGNES